MGNHIIHPNQMQCWAGNSGEVVEEGAHWSPHPNSSVHRRAGAQVARYLNNLFSSAAVLRQPAHICGWLTRCTGRSSIWVLVLTLAFTCHETTLNLRLLVRWARFCGGVIIKSPRAGKQEVCNQLHSPPFPSTQVSWTPRRGRASQELRCPCSYPLWALPVLE